MPSFHDPESGFTWYVLDVNPEPWAIGPVSVGRKNGKVFGTVGRNQQLYNFQQAVKEELGDGHEMIVGPIELRIFLWRRRDEYQTPQARTHRKHEADATNMQKAIEDACQGVLFKNDKDVKYIRTYCVEQGPDVTPLIVLAVRPGQIYRATDMMPYAVNALIEEVKHPLLPVDLSMEE